MIWLIGNKGMLGTELSLLLEQNNIPFIGTDREVDITDPAALRDFASSHPVNWIINCAAYTAVDKAEDDEVACRLLNTSGPANIAAAARDKGARLIHISTDYVFDGTGNRPYTEEDATCPTGVYGSTKRDGELAVIENNPHFYIIRTAWLYGKHGNNFVHTMLRLMNEREEIKVVHDQYGSPTWAFDLAQVIISLMQQVDGTHNIPCGIYHYTGEGTCTWFEFAQAIYAEGKSLNLLTKPCTVKPCTSAEYPAKVKRPAYSVLDKTKTKSIMRIIIPAWNDSLRSFLQGHDNS
ncbi:MAG: dTDP-4-dehydrorhamnose reductase [Treponema sp.]|nr:dTDP-4-dehydrorhamnose reductase [Treponema sp.]